MTKKQVLAFLMVALSPSIAFAAITWDGDWETGDWRQWNALFRDLDFPESWQFAIVPSPLRQGSYAARFTVHPADIYKSTGGERCEVYGGKGGLNNPIPQEEEGSNIYYAWSTLFPDDWPGVEPGHWLIILQFHADYCCPNPNLAFEIYGDQILHMRLRGGNCTIDYENHKTLCSTNGTFTVLPSIQKSVWHDFVIHVKWTTTSNGLVQVWHKLGSESKYIKVIDISGVATLQNISGVGPFSSHKQFGIYRGASSLVHELYHDGFRQGKTFKDVAFDRRRFLAVDPGFEK